MVRLGLVGMICWGFACVWLLLLGLLFVSVWIRVGFGWLCLLVGCDWLFMVVDLAITLVMFCCLWWVCIISLWFGLCLLLDGLASYLFLVSLLCLFIYLF